MTRTIRITNDQPSSSAPAEFICRLTVTTEQPLADAQQQRVRDDQWTAFARRLASLGKPA